MRQVEQARNQRRRDVGRVAREDEHRIVARFGHLAAIRESLLGSLDLPAATRHALIVKVSQALAGFAVARNWLDEGRAHRIVQEACEKATVTLAANSLLGNT